MASRSRSRSPLKKEWICPISQDCHKFVCIDKANFKIVFPRTRKLTSNNELYFIYMSIELLVDNDKGLLNLCTRLRASDGALMDFLRDPFKVIVYVVVVKYIYLVNSI